jgi:hypothetical protein
MEDLPMTIFKFSVLPWQARLKYTIETIHTSIRSQTPEATNTEPDGPKKLLRRYGWDVLIVVAMGILLYKGLFGQIFSDVPIYQCYAVAFWKGLSALNTLPAWQCSFLTQPGTTFTSIITTLQLLQTYHVPAALIQFVVNQVPYQPFHSLPHEYPLPTIIPFILPMLASSSWYRIVFAISMSLVAAVVYGLLRIFRSRSAAGVFALYLVIGGWATADGRFDLIPSALTLVALLFGMRKHWNWAFAFLALATVFKFYPLVLLLPFLLTQQREYGARWGDWRRFTPLAVFAAICMAIVTISLCLSVTDTLAPLSYFENRPFQVETSAASIFWLFHFLGYPFSPIMAYNSFSVLSPLASTLSLINTLLLVAGLAYVWCLQWRGNVDLPVSCLLTLLIVIFTGKVFSPQYLIWLIPLAAYIGERKLRWVVAWCLLGGLTTCIFPYLYQIYLYHFQYVSDAPLFYMTIAIRNLFFFCMLVLLLLSYTQKGCVSSTA